jgi:hypothetical protein
LKNDRDPGVRNGTLGTVTDVNRDAMRVVPDGMAAREVSFNLRDYAAFDHGYAATVQKAQGATVDRSFVLATPGMDGHLAYVGTTRHREGVELYAGPDDFKSLDNLKEGLSRARPGSGKGTLGAAPGTHATSGAGTEDQGQERKPEAGQGYPVGRFKQAQKEFMQVAGVADFDSKAKTRAGELPEKMKRADGTCDSKTRTGIAN